MKKYLTKVGGDNWRFHCVVKDKVGVKKPLYLKQATDTHIRRHKKIKADANPFDPSYAEYFAQRKKERYTRLINSNKTESAGLRIIQPYASLSGVR